MTARKPAKKTAQKKIIRKAKPKVAPRQQTALVDKAIDLIKWVDNPFKLLTVILLGGFGLSGWLAYENRDKIVNRIIADNTLPVMLSDEKLIEVSQKAMRDLQAETAVIYSIDLSKNSRVTRIALSSAGRNTSLEKRNAAFFSGSPYRNKAAISVLTGEMHCEDFQPSSDIGDWLIERGVVYACRASIPPEVGSMVGYVTFGFKKAPRDLIAVKSRIGQATAEMAK